MQHPFSQSISIPIPKAFISYARDGSHGENLAAEIQQQLQSAGFAVFRDVIGLKPGDVWYHKLEFELETSDVMVLVVSEKIRTSKWVHNEVSMAEEIGIPVIPVLAEKVRYPLWLRHLQVLDFCGARDWRALLAVKAGLPASSCPATPRPPAEVPAPRQMEEGKRNGLVAGRYMIHNNGTVTDTETGLMWKRCSEGQTGVDCGGEPATYTWDDAMSKFGKGVSFAGYSDWRMPTIDELKTLVDKKQHPAINQTAFPNTPARWYWSSTEKDASGAWVVYFGSGLDLWSNRNFDFSVRLVRSGQ
ncbi:DUF1566 domain-containing protein [Candidatus Thiothrix sp. Deng01]|uniref:DUF1566 domain-containing protein n=1 Tax=Candidatus Thiothrix phosphatis TaxID=3112415 RepID=A0ABU6D0R5_9GAMM|nr:DUF1566 domain-containing protein [Candidatus Thiothrix sp. Deng01]MEB4592625.1 DUF1566 domain-containing protein [Candidatus Thiothrix sp. Deng01]